MKSIKSMAIKAAVCAAVCLMTLIGSNLAAPGTVSADGAILPIGVIDYQELINKHPDTAKANEALQAESIQEQKDFDAQASKLSDQDKQQLAQKLRQQFAQKRQELAAPIMEKINAAINEVMAEKGLSMIVYKSAVFCGGQDITPDVLKKIGAN